MRKAITKTFLVAALVMMAVAIPAAAQIGVFNAGTLNNIACNYSGTIGQDTTTGDLYGCGDNHVFSGGGPATTQTYTHKTIDTATNTFKSNGSTVGSVSGVIGTYQGTTATPITTGNFTVLAGPAISLSAGTANVAGKTVVIEGYGVYTTGAASLLNIEISLCTVSGCGSGTVLSPAGCLVTSTNQANVLANGQFRFRCLMTTATTGATGTVMAKSIDDFQLGSATTAALSEFGDTATAVSAAVDLTVAEFVTPQFKFTSSNAGNSATLLNMTVLLLG
jgi:hypothetical protein